jgi:hypothetical protein
LVNKQYLPLLFDHFEKVPVIHDTVKHRPKRHPIVATECRRETDDRDFMGQDGGHEVGVWMFDIGVEVGQQSSISVHSDTEVIASKTEESTDEGAAAWCASSITIAFKDPGLNFLTRSA